MNVNDGNFIVYNEQTPPLLDNMKVIIEKRIKISGKLFDFSKTKKSKTVIASNTIHNYAVIISGGANAYNNWIRYWNDCAAIYSVLTNIYGYADDHIYVLISDGTSTGKDRHHYDGSYDSSPLDLDGDGDNDIRFAATRANITQVCNTLKNKLTSDDNLLIYTMDHGGWEGTDTDVFLNLWNNEVISDNDFDLEINKINAGIINICMGQCNSGGFIDDLQTENRVISTACRFDESSYAKSNLIYDEFVYHWTAAIAGQTPDGTSINADSNNDGYISMQEAFQYAGNRDAQPEHPQYSSTPTTLGEISSLKAMYISGSDLICEQGAYTINNLPERAMVQWMAGQGLTIISGQGTSTATFGKYADGASSINAKVIKGSASQELAKFEIWLGKPKFWYIDGYESLSCPGSEYYRAVCNGFKNCSFYWNVTPYCDILLCGKGTSAVIDFPAEGVYTISVTATNSCGSVTAYHSVTVEHQYPMPKYSIHSLSPNPATDMVTVTLQDNDETGITTKLLRSSPVSQPYEVQLWNGSQLLRSYKTAEPHLQIPLDGLPAGIYIVRVIKDGKAYSQKLIKK